MGKQNFQIDYYYHNTTNDFVELWLSEPKETSTQQDVTVTANKEPDHITKHDFMNHIWYYKLNPGEKLEATFTYSGVRKGTSSSPITEDEKNFFLRSTELIPVDEQVKKEAEAIVGDAQTDWDKAKRLYTFITEKFSYSTSFNKRGVGYFLDRKKGDCGEFGALFCSYCRSLGIPAKMLYGTWTLRRFSPHAWSEIYIEGNGWMPVDPSMGRLKVKYHPFLNISTSIYYGVLGNKDKYFGEIEGKRFAFSIEPERQLHPTYNDTWDYYETIEKECFANKEVAWGYQSLDGKAPFLQPVYPRLHSKETKTPFKLLFGDWKGKHLERGRKLTYKLKLASFNLGFLFLLLEMVNDFIFKQEALVTLLPLISNPLILLGTLLSVVRKEGSGLIYLLGIAFVLSFLSNLSNL